MTVKGGFWRKMRTLLSTSSSSSSSSSSSPTGSKKHLNGGRGGDSKDDVNSSSTAPLYLNVYDLTPINNYLYWLGLGIFHSGIEVHGMEYAFGAHDYPASGVFEVEPKSCPGFIYRRSICLGTTNMSRLEFLQFIEHLSGNYHGDTYHLIAKNCNHFTEDVCKRLTGKRIPGWVNRLAKYGSFCNCLLPEHMQVSAVRHLPDHPVFSDGSESFASSDGESDEEEPNHHLLWTSKSGSASPREKIMGVTVELQ